MKAYLITTGLVFAALVLAHVARVMEEGTYLLREPVFVVTTIFSAALGVWAWRLLRRMRHGGKTLSS